MCLESPGEYVFDELLAIEKFGLLQFELFKKLVQFVIW